ncbi:LemA family protein [Thermus islandicus]|uniref:LemA family protein n=1 Tax=Thermus islandicus TaxID=540988 RepID=UPI0003B63940|nr:LemA family protein [Thermus islandicus]
MGMILWVPVLLLVLLAVWAYNTVVARKNQVENAFGAVEAQLKKRRDLIPNLVEAVKQYMAYEKDLLEKLTRLREALEGTKDAEEALRLEGELSRALAALRLRAEAYPDLKASQNFLQLQAALTEAEDSIAAARRFYNQAVTEYNNVLEQIPFAFFARALGLSRKPVFTLPQEEREAPDLRGLFGR